MSPAQHLRQSTEPGPLGLLLWACTAVIAVLCSVYALPWWVLLPIGLCVVVCAWAIAQMDALCDDENSCVACMVGQGRDCKCSRLEQHDGHSVIDTGIEPWHMPHTGNNPNDGGA